MNWAHHMARNSNQLIVNGLLDKPLISIAQKIKTIEKVVHAEMLETWNLNHLPINS